MTYEEAVANLQAGEDVELDVGGVLSVLKSEHADKDRLTQELQSSREQITSARETLTQRCGGFMDVLKKDKAAFLERAKALTLKELNAEFDALGEELREALAVPRVTQTPRDGAGDVRVFPPDVSRFRV